MSRYKAYSEYRDSGVEWFDSVPTHWDVKRISYISQLRSGDAIVSEKIEAEGDYPVYGGNGLRGYASNFNLDGEFILIGRQGALCGNINYGSGRFWASEHAVVVYPSLDVNIKWLGETLRAMNLNQYNVSAAQPGLAVANITWAVSSLKCNTRLKVHDFPRKYLCWGFKVEAFARAVV